VAPFARERFVDADAREALLVRLVEGGSVTDYLLRMRRRQRTPVWVEVTGARRVRRGTGLLRVEASSATSASGNGSTTSRRHLSAVLQSEKMAALGQRFRRRPRIEQSAGDDPELRAERLSEKPLDDTSRRGASVILGEAERAARIVRNLLTFARKRSRLAR